MKSIDRTAGSLRIKGPLVIGPSSRSFFAVERGRKRGARWVLKWVGEPAGGSIRDLLREDMARLASLVHPSLALPTGFEIDHEKGRAAILRPYIIGSEVLLAARGRSTRDLIPWLVSAAEALRLLHRFGFLHRNLKASNIIVSPAAVLSRAAVILCDPAWWPEGKEERASPAEDLHALGRVFYRLLAGKEAEDGEGGFPAPPSRFNPEVGIDLERLVLKALHPDPARRYRDATALVDDLRRIAGARSPPPLGPPDCFLDRRDELRRAAERLESVRPAALAVTGEAGMGKSAFLHRLVLDAQLRGVRAVRVQCYSGSGAPLAPILALADGLFSTHPSGRALGRTFRRLLGETSREDPGKLDPGARQRLLRGLLDIFAEGRGVRPAALFVDDAHLADSMTIEFLAGLVRDLDGPPPGRTPPALVVSHRTESPFRAALRPLSEAFDAGGAKGGSAIELHPLPKGSVEEWLDLVEYPEGEERREIVSGLKGHPLALHQAIRRKRARRGEAPAARADLSSIHGDYLASLAAEAGEVLDLLAVLGRPAHIDVLREVLDLTESKLRPSLGALLADGALAEDGGLLFFRHGSFRSHVQEAIPEREKETLHRKIAEVLERRGGAPGEVAEHWLHSGEPRRGVPAALAAARDLARSHEDRKALVFYQAVLEHLPKGDRRTRRTVGEEAAEALSRAGEHQRGVEALEKLLRGARGRAEAGHLHARSGILAHRSGDAARAAFHLEKALDLLARAGGGDAVRERLDVLSELAEIANTKGDYVRAEALCRQALEELEGPGHSRRDPRILREEMVILETLATIRLRRFQYAEAEELFERSLAVGEPLGAIPEKGLILNNLGTLHVQENRFHKAIECYERAARLAERLRDGQSLSVIQSNLAVLRARTGEPEAADRAMRAALERDARGGSTRSRFVRLHSAGIVDLTFGRYASAIDSFRSAVVLGEELKDLHIAAFELVYLAECHLFRGEGKAARAALERAVGLGPPPPAPVVAMVEARKAALAALRGDSRGARTALQDAAERRDAAIPFIDAWNGVFRGWASRLVGSLDEARAILEEARSFFAGAKVPSGEVLASLEIAAAEAEAGRGPSAQKRIQGLRARFRPGEGPLASPMLSARLLSYQAKLLLTRERPEVDEAAALLLEAESYLIGRRLGELESVTADLRDRIRRASRSIGWKSTSPSGAVRPAGWAPRTGGPAPAALDSFIGDPLEMLGALKEEVSGVLRRIGEDLGPEIGEDRVRGLCRSLGEFEERLREAERSLERRSPEGSGPLRVSSILGGSSAIRRVVDQVLKVAPTKLPVLVSGETGAGKEVVARAVHGESPRRGAPLVSVNCAALPEPLLEAQLFGVLRGAYSGADEDRPGLLIAAHGGTFLFDEIAEMPLGLQAKLLRFLDRGRLRPLGGAEEIEVDVRYLFSSNRDLRALVKEGEFREDLFFRLSTFEVQVPPLRERLEDLPALVEHFRALAAGTRDSPRFGEEALQALASHPWPGNVRELQNVVTRLCLTSSGEVRGEQVRLLIGKAPVHRLVTTAVLRSRPLDQLLAELEREFLLQLHADRGGDLEAMASALGITVRALYGRFRRLGIRPRDLG